MAVKTTKTHQDEQPEANNLHGRIVNIAKHFAREGIAKNSENKQQNYQYRGIDAVLDQFSTPLAKEGITMTPSVRIVSHGNHKTKSSELGMMSVVELTIIFSDGINDRTYGPFIGEAYDSLDKSMSKAQSVAFRNLLLLSFCVPLGPGYDPDNDEGDDDEAGDQGGGLQHEPARNEPELPDGMYLSPAQEKWIMARADMAGLTKDQLLKKYRRIDANNCQAIGNGLSK